MRLLVLLEVVNPLIERPRDVFPRRPIKAKSIKPRYVLDCQFLSLAVAGSIISSVKPNVSKTGRTNPKHECRQKEQPIVYTE